MNLRAFSAIGIDVGGTKIAAGLVQFPAGTISLKRVIPTEPQRGGARVLDDIIQLTRALSEEANGAGKKVTGIGLGLCELVSPDGRVLSENAIRWMDLPVLERFSGHGPFLLEADVRAAARAEAVFGAGRGLHQFLYVTVGTGISSCLVLEGEPYMGTRGATGTMASAPWNRACEECGGRSQWNLEEYAAGPGLVRRVNARRPGSVRTGHDVLNAARNGDALALEVVETSAAALGSTVALLVNVLDPEAVVVGGGLGLSNGPYWDSFVPATRQHIWSPVHRDIPIVQAATGVDAGVIGAALSICRIKGVA